MERGGGRVRVCVCVYACALKGRRTKKWKIKRGTISFLDNWAGGCWSLSITHSISARHAWLVTLTDIHNSGPHKHAAIQVYLHQQSANSLHTWLDLLCTLFVFYFSSKQMCSHAYKLKENLNSEALLLAWFRSTFPLRGERLLNPAISFILQRNISFQWQQSLPRWRRSHSWGTRGGLTSVKMMWIICFSIHSHQNNFGRFLDLSTAIIETPNDWVYFVRVLCHLSSCVTDI